MSSISLLQERANRTSRARNRDSPLEISTEDLSLIRHIGFLPGSAWRPPLCLVHRGPPL